VSGNIDAPPADPPTGAPGQITVSGNTDAPPADLIDSICNAWGEHQWDDGHYELTLQLNNNYYLSIFQRSLIILLTIIKSYESLRGAARAIP
jgi:hypothetical protein